MSSSSRRAFLRAAACIAAAASVPTPVFAQAAATGPFLVPPLDYAFTALQPHIDPTTMEIHHDRHHAVYVANLNNVAKDYPQIVERPVTEVLAKLDKLPEAIRTMVRNNLGGHANHTMFWDIMGPDGSKPDAELLAAIDRDFGGVEKFHADFNAAGAAQVGSGWVFVTVTRDGKLKIETRPNQDTPLMDGKRVLLGNDVWEHAYYLNYQNRRAEYLKAWWNTVNWKRVAERYAAATSGTLGV